MEPQAEPSHTYIPHHTPRRRRRQLTWPAQSPFSPSLLLLLLASFAILPSAFADPLLLDRRETLPGLPGVGIPQSSNLILLDTRDAPAAKELEARDSSFVMPTAFDANIGNNFTEPACFAWFKGFLDNISPCHPVSLMLQTSTSFFDATKSLVTITRVLSTSCNVNYGQCSNLLDKYLGEILRSDICQIDYNNGNPIVTEAYAGLLAYKATYGATCLTDSSNDGNYCYAEAITNTSTPSASYIYYLPLGFTLPAGMNPTCNDCLKRTMQGFATYAADSSQPLSKTYASAAAAVDVFCGPTFVDQNIPLPSGAALRATLNLATVALATMLAGSWLLLI